MIGVIIGYLIGKAKQNSKESNFLTIMKDLEKDFSMCKDLEIMFLVMDSLKSIDILRWEMNKMELSLPNIEYNSKYIQFYILPIAYLKLSFIHKLDLTLFIVRKLTDNDKVLQDSLLTISIIEWSMNGEIHLGAYLGRLLDCDFDDIPKDNLLKEAIMIAYEKTNMENAIQYATENKIDAEIRGAIVGAIMENTGFHNYDRESIYVDFDRYDNKFPLSEDSFYFNSKYGLFIGYKRLDGYYWWHLENESQLKCNLKGNKSAPFKEELIYWEWLKKNYSKEGLLAHINDSIYKESLEQIFNNWTEYISNIYIDFMNKAINVELNNAGTIIVFFGDYKFESIFLLAEEDDN